MFSKMVMKAYIVVYDANTSGFIEENIFFCHFCYFLLQKIRFTFKHLNTVKTYFQLTAFGKISVTPISFKIVSLFFKVKSRA